MGPQVANLTVSAGGESLSVRGRPAELISIILRNRERIEAIPVGQLILSFAED